MKRLPALLILICLLIPTLAFAEDIYIAQTSSGANSGADCADAYAISWLNTASNWGAGAGQIGPGDTVHLCGTFTTALNIRGSGTSSSPITILFESGANFTKGNWNQSGNNNGNLSDAAIYGQSLSYIVIDGGTSGLIQSTSNGTALATQLHCVGVQFYSSSNITVRNLTVKNMYVRTSGSTTDTNQLCGCIQFRQGASNVTINNNTVSDANVTIYIEYNGGSNISIYNNTGTRAGEGVVVFGAQSTSSTLSGSNLIYNNTFTKDLTWSGAPGTHTNLMHIHSVQSNSSISGLQIYDNTFQGQCGTNATSLVFLEGIIHSPLVYNNIFYYNSDLTGQGCGNGMFVPKGPDSLLFANNTLVATTQGQGTGYGTTSYGAGDTGGVLRNNLFYGIGLPIYDTVPSIASSNYNVFYCSSGSYPEFTQASYAFASFSQWQTHTGFDANSTTNQPSLGSNFCPTSSDTVAKDKACSTACGGTYSNLTPYFATDIIGTSRPQGLAWDIGAYEYVPAALPQLQKPCLQSNMLTITASAGTNGSMSPSGSVSVCPGNYQTFTITPQSGYTASVSGTCGGSLVGTTYTTNPITTACTVSATFTQ